MNNFFNSFALFVVAAVLALAGLAQGLVALFELLGKRRKPWIIVLGMVACLLIAGLAGYGALNAPAADRQASSPTSTTNVVPPSPTSLAQKTYAEQEGRLGAPTFVSPYSGNGGSKIPAGAWVQVSCKVYAPTIPRSREPPDDAL